MAGSINCNTALIIGLNITLNEIKFKGAILRHFCFPILSNFFFQKYVLFNLFSEKRYHEFLGLFHNLEFLSVELIRKLCMKTNI